MPPLFWFWLSLQNWTQRAGAVVRISIEPKSKQFLAMLTLAWLCESKCPAGARGHHGNLPPFRCPGPFSLPQKSAASILSRPSQGAKSQERKTYRHRIRWIGMQRKVAESGCAIKHAELRGICVGNAANHFFFSEAPPASSWLWWGVKILGTWSFDLFFVASTRLQKFNEMLLLWFPQSS